jgi:hypothetical protein
MPRQTDIVTNDDCRVRGSSWTLINVNKLTRSEQVPAKYLEHKKNFQPFQIGTYIYPLMRIGSNKGAGGGSLIAHLATHIEHGDRIRGSQI